MGGRGVGPIAPRGEGIGRHQQGLMRRLLELSPEEQERLLANDERFKRLPRERQERIRENLRRWNQLSPEQKQRILARQRAFAQLSVEQQEEARALFQRWRELPMPRRRALMQGFREMRNLPADQRRSFVTRPDVEKRFSPEERNLLVGLARLIPESDLGTEDESQD